MYPIWVHCQWINREIESCEKLSDNEGMKKIQHSVRWEGWLSNAIDEWGRKNGKKNFSDSVNYLLACELDRRGYKREIYEPGIYEPLIEQAEPGINPQFPSPIPEGAP
jgi:hypothetical protein